ncbi:MAG: hypothetical protein MRQ13_02910 [Candidatus Midichloria sp.]|nr:hypothetical protein [Candidatus Midichloria sp.]
MHFAKFSLTNKKLLFIDCMTEDLLSNNSTSAISRIGVKYNNIIKDILIKARMEDELSSFIKANINPQTAIEIRKMLRRSKMILNIFLKTKYNCLLGL